MADDSYRDCFFQTKNLHLESFGGRVECPRKPGSNVGVQTSTLNKTQVNESTHLVFKLCPQARRASGDP